MTWLNNSFAVAISRVRTWRTVLANPASLDPVADPDIVGPAGIFSSSEFSGNREFQKTASVMKLVLEGYAGAGTITMGGYDYHTGERGTGERRDEQAGRCMAPAWNMRRGSRSR